MRIMILKQIGLFFLLIICASLFSTSFAGRQPRFVNPQDKVAAVHHQEQVRHEVSEIHERLLKVNTKDYGSYDPAPALVKPPFKLIPN